MTARPLDSGRPFRVNYAGFDLKRERTGALSAKDYLIHSYEDSFLGYACSRRFEANHDAFVGRSARRLDVLVLRDPFNLFASRRAMGASTLPAATAVRMWKQHAAEYLGRPRYLKRDPVFVNYNRWVACREYRRGLAGRLGLAFTDAGVDAVPACGGGSSFDGVRFDGRARRMPVFERWLRFAGDPGYDRLFDPELVGLASRIFGDLPASERLPGTAEACRGVTAARPPRGVRPGAAPG